MKTSIKKLLLFPKVWRAISLMTEAWDLTAYDKNVEAEKMFEKGEQKFLQISMNLPYEFKIMKGQIKFKLRKREECLEIFKKAWDEINADNTLDTADKLYLKEYIFSALKIYRDFWISDLHGIEPISVLDVPLEKVSVSWKKQFPSRDHPDWDKYGVK